MEIEIKWNWNGHYDDGYVLYWKMTHTKGDGGNEESSPSKLFQYVDGQTDGHLSIYPPESVALLVGFSRCPAPIGSLARVFACCFACTARSSHRRPVRLAGWLALDYLYTGDPPKQTYMVDWSVSLVVDSFLGSLWGASGSGRRVGEGGMERGREGELRVAVFL